MAVHCLKVRPNVDVIAPADFPPKQMRAAETRNIELDQIMGLSRNGTTLKHLIKLIPNGLQIPLASSSDFFILFCNIASKKHAISRIISIKV